MSYMKKNKIIVAVEWYTPQGEMLNLLTETEEDIVTTILGNTLKLLDVVELEVYGKHRKISYVVRKVPGGKYVKCVPISQTKIAKLIEYKENIPNLYIGCGVEAAKEKRDDVPLLSVYKTSSAKIFMNVHTINCSKLSYSIVFVSFDENI